MFKRINWDLDIWDFPRNSHSSLPGTHAIRDHCVCVCVCVCQHRRAHLLSICSSYPDISYYSITNFQGCCMVLFYVISQFKMFLSCYSKLFWILLLNMALLHAWAVAGNHSKGWKCEEHLLSSLALWIMYSTLLQPVAQVPNSDMEHWCIFHPTALLFRMLLTAVLISWGLPCRRPLVLRYCSEKDF